MGKSKKSAVAVQVPSFAASGLDKKKGKRGLEVASTLVSSTKKQKTAERHILSLKKVSPEETSESEEEQVPKVLIGKKGGPKTKALGKKAPAPESSEDESSDEPSKPVLKKEVAIQGKVGKGIALFKNVNPAATESSDEDSESEDLKPSKPAVKKQPPGVQNPPAKESSDESSDDSESEEEIKNAEKTAAKSVKNVSKKKESSTDDSSDSDDEEEPTIKLVKAAGKPAAKPLPKKAESSDDDSSDESDDESDEEPQIKKNKIVPSTKLVKATGKPVAKPLPKKAESSDEDSSEESDDESDEEPQIKKNKIMPAVKTAAKKVETSDEDDSSEESEEEDSGKELDSKKQKISGKPVVAPPSKKVESSDEDSSEESEEDSDEEPQIKKQKVAEKPEVKVPAKKKESSDEEDSSEDDSDEEPRSKKQKMAPIKASGKVAANGKTQTNGEEEEMQEQKTKFKNQKYENANEEVTPGRESSGGGSKTIFVKNLAWSVDEDTVAEFFQAAGEVKEVRLAMDGNQRFRGFGHVEFTTESGAKKACEKSGEPLAGREIYVDLAKDRLFSPSSGGKQDWNSPRSGGFGANDKQGGFRSGSDMTAFVRGFDKFQDEDSIRGGLQDFFSECGNIQGIRLPSDRETGQIKGFAYVEFSDKDALSKAVELNGADLNGRYLFIEAAGQGGGGGGRGDGGGRGGRGGRGGGRGDFGGGRGRGGGGGRGGGWGGRGGGAPRQKVNLAPSGTGKKTTFGDE